MEKKAIVFDISGTLLKRCRAVKNMKTGEMSDEVSSLDIIDQIKDTILVVLQTDIEKTLLSASPNEKLYDFIKDNDIKMDISYSSSDFDKNELIPRLKNSNVLLSEFFETTRYLMKKNSFIQLCSGSAFIFNTKTNEVEYIITAAGELFPKISTVMETLKKRGIETFIASGDRFESLLELAEIMNIPKENVFETANTKKKAEIIKNLKQEYKVMMVGNGPNDILAFKKSDLAVLTLEQGEEISQKVHDAADVEINNIFEVLAIDF
ncbi:MAG: HAD family hydrolase [Methanobrevibacter sp.]|nr:HAD family hydrolase [Methanobrevibacter sp.]